jgi:hypothetical protein
MSERGLILALQRLHDDPGFVDRVREDSESSLGIYDLDETECQTLIQAINNNDRNTIHQMASQVGIDWTAEHIGGVGALDEREVSLEQQPSPGIQGTGALPGDGYEGVMPTRTTGT